MLSDVWTHCTRWSSPHVRSIWKKMTYIANYTMITSNKRRLESSRSDTYYCLKVQDKSVDIRLHSQCAIKYWFLFSNLNTPKIWNEVNSPGLGNTHHGFLDTFKSISASHLNCHQSGICGYLRKLSSCCRKITNIGDFWWSGISCFKSSFQCFFKMYYYFFIIKCPATEKKETFSFLARSWYTLTIYAAYGFLSKPCRLHRCCDREPS